MSNYILTLKLNTEKYQEDILNKRFEIGRKIYNACLNELYKRYRTMQQSKEYQKICKLPKSKERNKEFQQLNNKYGLTEYSLHKFVKSMQKHFKNNIDSFTAQKIATRCFDAFKGLMFHKSDKIHFKPYGEMYSLEGKSNKTGIRFKDNQLIWNDLKISIVINKNDIYVQQTLNHEIKYCRIKSEMIKGKTKYYIQLVLEGIPPVKYDKDGNFKVEVNTDERVGIDIGTQTIAICSKNNVKLLELAPEINNIEKQVRIFQRKLDRSKRAVNPNKYNENSTINIKDKSKWIKSNHYIKTQCELKELQRKQREIRKQSHSKLANYILTLGDEVFVETMNYKGLQVRAKETTVNEKTGKFNKKKRFGKSLANKAPSMFLTILNNKLKWQEKELQKIDTYSAKASQYNHITNEYVKKGLSERWNDFGDFKIQRDLYSAFLIMNVKDNLKEVSKKRCENNFEWFRELHDKEIIWIKTNSSKIISSMGI